MTSPRADGVAVIDSSPAMTLGRRHAVKSFSIRIGSARTRTRWRLRPGSPIGALGHASSTGSFGCC